MGLDFKKASVQLIQGRIAVDRAGESAWRILSLSPADPIIAYRKMLCVAIERPGRFPGPGDPVFIPDKDQGSTTDCPSRKTAIRHRRPWPLRWPCTSPSANSLKTEIALSVPKPWAVIKTVEFPVSTLENLPVVVASELDRITPFTPEEVYYDFKIQSRNEEKVSLLVIAARADRIRPLPGGLPGKRASSGRFDRSSGRNGNPLAVPGPRNRKRSSWKFKGKAMKAPFFRTGALLPF